MALKNQIATLGSGAVIKGVYMNDERVRDTITNLNETLSDSIASGKPYYQLQMFASITNYVRSFWGTSYKMIWVPTLRGESTPTDNKFYKIAYAIHKAYLFDYVYLQPGYYFMDSASVYVKLAKTSVAKNEMYTITNNGEPIPIPPTTMSNKIKQAIIGVQMEIDGNYFVGRLGTDTEDKANATALQNRYNFVADALFKNITTNPGTYVQEYNKNNVYFSHYVGAKYPTRSSPANSNFFNLIAKIY